MGFCIKKVPLQTIKYLCGKGLFFYVNLFILTALLFLIEPLFYHKSPNAFAFGYSLRYIAYLAFMAVSWTVFFILTLIKDKQFNQYLFFSVLFICISLELALTWLQGRRPHIEDDDYIFRVPKPYVMFTGKPGLNKTVSTFMIDRKRKKQPLILNELGFRKDNKLLKQKNENEFRVFVLGGSTIFFGSPVSNTIPLQLEELFQRDGYQNVRVYNFGAVSYVSGQELSLLLHTLVDYNPDLVIIYDGGNDIHQTYNYDPRPGYPYNYLVYESGFDQIKKGVTLKQIIAAGLSKTSLGRILFRHQVSAALFDLDQKRKDVGYKSDKWEHLILSKYKHNLDKMCKLAKGFDFKMAAFLQPTIHFKSNLIGNEKRLLGDEEFQAYIKRQYDRARKLFTQLNEKYANQDHCHFSDLSYALKDYDKETYWDFIHIDNEGNRFMAKQVYQQLEQYNFAYQN